ncbi:hypothetical protein EJ104_06955 [Deinococcus radiophilus]|uniref:Uncharacterized protein n=1 Tax=Deinococcus radiophilus TaxID=32062 RepID=A0A3S0KBX2_9DEIO|nr:hypothetical protein EJ104_06955 [Deinococcus radiophilus]
MWPLLLVPALLGSCSRQADTFQPRIVVTAPEGGGVARADNLFLKGYLMDDTGAIQLTINDQAVPLDSGSPKIKYFSYQPEVQGTENSFVLKARDRAGNESTMTMDLNIDAEPPELAVSSFERIGKTIRVSGEATDNDQVAEILVDGRRLNSPVGTRVTFYAETQGIYADITVRDRAGNTVERRVE